MRCLASLLNYVDWCFFGRKIVSVALKESGFRKVHYLKCLFHYKLGVLKHMTMPTVYMTTE